MAKHPFDPKQAETICSYIRQGGFPHIAAEAAGLPLHIFNNWMTRGQAKKAKEPYRSFAKNIRQAQAMGRLLAEIDARQAAPLTWLARGPGRDSPNSPGWARESKPHTIQDNRTFNFLSPEWLSLWSRLLAALQDFPEARVALSHTLNEMGGPVPLPKAPLKVLPSENE